MCLSAFADLIFHVDHVVGGWAEHRSAGGGCIAHHLVVFGFILPLSCLSTIIIVISPVLLHFVMFQVLKSYYLNQQDLLFLSDFPPHCGVGWWAVSEQLCGTYFLARVKPKQPLRPTTNHQYLSANWILYR